jgi:hypothetical protein
MADCINPDGIHISSDQLLVAVVCTSRFHIYSVPQLAGSASSSIFDVLPIRSIEINGSQICSFSWCSSSEQPSSFLLLSTAGVLYTGDLLIPDLRKVATDVKAAAWSASSAHFAYVTSSATLVFSQVACKPPQLLAVQLSHPESKNFMYHRSSNLLAIGIKDRYGAL